MNDSGQVVGESHTTGNLGDPAVFVTVVPNLIVDETFSTARGEAWRIVAIETDIEGEVVELGISGVFTVELL